MKRRTKDERDSAAFPRAKTHEGVVDTAEEGAMETVLVVGMDPHGACVGAPSVLALGDQGGLDGSADEGQDGEVSAGLVDIVDLDDDGTLSAHVVGVVDALVRLDGLKSEPLSEGVGGIEGLGTHALAARTAVSR